MILASIRRPQIMGQLAPDVFTGMRENFPEQNVGTVWYRDLGRQIDKTGLAEILEPLTELLVSQFVSLIKREPWGIYYEVNTQTVAPKEAQRPAAWHVDQGRRNGVSVVVADAMPTEFLIAKGRLTQLKAAALQARVRREFILGDPAHQGAIAAGFVQEYVPAPYDIAVMRGHIHRSPINLSDGPVARTWMRAIIHHRQP